MIKDKVQLGISTLPPVTTNARVEVVGSAIVFQNVGNDTAFLDNHFTLLPGQSISFNTSEDINVLAFDAKITFEGVGGSPRIDIIEIRANLPGYGNYIRE
jgi:hypothetical protein